MHIIVDSNNVIQDISTEKANLSRGYGYPGYKLYEIENCDVIVGDFFADGKVVKNEQIRAEIEQVRQNESKIENKQRQIAIAALKAEGQLPPDYGNEVTHI